MPTEFLNSLRSPGVPEHELKLTVYGDKKHLSPGLANEQHQGHRERDRPTPGHRRHTCSRGRAKRAPLLVIIKIIVVRPPSVCPSVTA